MSNQSTPRKAKRKAEARDLFSSDGSAYDNRCLPVKKQSSTSASLASKFASIVAEIAKLEQGDKIEAINQLRSMLHQISPFASEPVDCVLWVKSESVTANDYNPNSVAPPEMKLLEHSITEDGYTQPIVSWLREDSIREVVDGFHRHRVGRESPVVSARVHGYLPVVEINQDRRDKSDRISATIRHNRARGKHQVGAMSDIVVELKRRNWSDDRICRELGMEQDEVLRLCQITGLAELFSDQEFSKSWDVDGQISEADFVELTDDVSSYGEEAKAFRTVNTGDEDRIFHTYDKWECHKAGFYRTTKDGMSKEECEQEYKRLLTNEAGFSAALERVITEWKNSCEHYLTNKAFNRIAWLGQAAVCIATGVPSECRGGFSLLTEAEQKVADQLALLYLNKWLTANGLAEVTLEAAYAYARQSDIY